MFGYPDETLPLVFDIFIYYLKYDEQQSIFDEIQGVWIADETLSRVFDKSSQSKQKLRSNGEVKSSKSMLVKTGYPNLLHGVIFFVLT